LHQLKCTTPLFQTAKGGHPAAVQVLVDRGADPNKAETVCAAPSPSSSSSNSPRQRDAQTSQMTPAHIAAKKDHDECLRKLIEAKADLKLADKVQYSCIFPRLCLAAPIHFALTFSSPLFLL